MTEGQLQERRRELDQCRRRAGKPPLTDAEWNARKGTEEASFSYKPRQSEGDALMEFFKGKK